MKAETPDPHLAMKFKAYPIRSWQTHKRSGDCEWHGRTKKLRELGKMIDAWGRDPK